MNNNNNKKKDKPQGTCFFALALCFRINLASRRRKGDSMFVFAALSQLA